MIEAWWAWLRRWRPCVPAETYGGKTAEEWAAICDQQALELAKHEQSITDLRAQLDTAYRRVDNLDDLRRDIRKLTEREGV